MYQKKSEKHLKFTMQEIAISPAYLKGLLDVLETEISQLTLFLSLVQQQNQLSLSEFSKKNWKRNMEKKKLQREFMQQLMLRRVH